MGKELSHVYLAVVQANLLAAELNVLHGVGQLFQLGMRSSNLQRGQT